MSKTVLKPVAELSYEEAYAELETIVAEMESGEGALEKSLEAFTRGQELIRRCSELLEQAELKVRQLSGDGLTEFTVEQ